jgi:hypothetical protein
MIDLSEPTVPEEGMGRLRLKVQDEGGRDLAARLCVQDGTGKAFVPTFAYTYRSMVPCFFLGDPGAGQIEVPPGRYRVRAMKGFEWELVETTVTVTGGGVHEAKLILRRRFAPGQRGWTCGDHHAHLFRHGGTVHPMMDLGDVYTAARAEGLNYLPFMGESRLGPYRRGLREPDFIAYGTDELTRDLWGHICPIGVRRPPSMAHHGRVWPMNYDLISAANERGGAVAFAHPYGSLRRGREFDMIADPTSGHPGRELPIDLALGCECTVDILTKGDAKEALELKLRDYMRLLDLGFRAGATASTDFHLDQGRQPIGAFRTYVRADSLTWPEVARAYREGRTFATNGPILLFKVDDASPGDTVNLRPGGSISCHVEAHSLWGLESVQVWMNGEVVGEMDARNGAIDEVLSVSPRGGGWVLAVATGNPTDQVVSSPEGRPMVEGQYAITSPVFLAGDAWTTPPRPESAKYFVRWVNAVEKAFERECSQMERECRSLPTEMGDMVRGRLGEARAVHRVTFHNPPTAGKQRVINIVYCRREVGEGAFIL